jgi:SAM-dependent methyltransferase
MDKLYDYPKYYEIAFSWRDIPAEVGVFEECVNRFSRIPVKSVLELACGNAPHLAELVKRGYRYTGMDSSQAMLDYVREKARALDAPVNLVRADMARFAITEPVDFAYVMLGSLYVANTEQLISHFDSMAAVLRPGGLYFMDWCVSFGTGGPGKEEWEIDRDGIRIKVTCAGEPADAVEQTSRGTDTLEVDDHGRRLTIRDESVRRVIYPQEFLHFILCRPDFDFVGWWNNWNLDQPLAGMKEINRPIVVVRRT